MDNVIKIKRKPRPLTKTYEPNSPYTVIRDDEEDGSIRYAIFDERPESYRFICATCDDAGLSDGIEEEAGKLSTAKQDADMIARALNLLVQYGLEK